MEVLALVLARGGSERIPGKNIKLLAGKPLIGYTIDAAKKSRFINRIVVSTDDVKIAIVARRFGAQVPFLRPENISQAGSKEISAMQHALKWLEKKESYVPDLVVKLFPTSPFRRPSSIDTAIELMMKHPAADSVRSVRLCKEHPYKMWKVKNGMLVPFVPWEKKPVEAHTFSYHLLPKTYVNNASIDVTRPATIFRKGSVTGKKILGLVMDEMESLDINMPLDFMVAEAAIRKKLVRLP